MHHFFKLITMSWQVQEKDGIAMARCKGCRSTSQLVLSFEKDTVIDWLYLSSLKTEEGDIPIKPSECNKGIFHYNKIYFISDVLPRNGNVAMLWCPSMWITRYVTDLVKTSQIWLMRTKVKRVTMTVVIMEGSVSFFFNMFVCGI